jgi:hypothetical protein
MEEMIMNSNKTVVFFSGFPDRRFTEEICVSGGGILPDRHRPAGLIK